MPEPWFFNGMIISGTAQPYTRQRLGVGMMCRMAVDLLVAIQAVLGLPGPLVEGLGNKYALLLGLLELKTLAHKL